MKLYRYFDKDFGTQLKREGKIRLGTFKKYQDMELNDLDEFRGDKDDGTKTIKIDHYEYDGSDASQTIQQLTGTASPKGVVFKNCVVNFGAPDCYVLCMSEIVCPELAKEFDNATECVEVFDLDLFFHYISKALRLCTGEHFRFLGCRPCEYKPSRIFCHQEPEAMKTDHLLLKPEKYITQKEYRAIWVPTVGSISRPYIDLVDSRLSRYCNLMDFRVHTGNGYSYKIFF